MIQFQKKVDKLFMSVPTKKMRAPDYSPFL